MAHPFEINFKRAKRIDDFAMSVKCNVPDVDGRQASEYQSLSYRPFPSAQLF